MPLMSKDKTVAIKQTFVPKLFDSAFPIHETIAFTFLCKTVARQNYAL